MAMKTKKSEARDRLISASLLRMIRIMPVLLSFAVLINLFLMKSQFCFHSI